MKQQAADLQAVICYNFDVVEEEGKWKQRQHECSITNTSTELIFRFSRGVVVLLEIKLQDRSGVGTLCTYLVQYLSQFWHRRHEYR